LVARQLVAADVTSNDVIQICFGTGGFEASLGNMLGAELIEASVIPEDPFHIEYQLAMLQNYRVTVLITTPTNAHELLDLLSARRTDPQALFLRTVLLTRPIPDAEREELQAGLFANVRCNFGVSEILDPGLCVECSEGRFHINEDQFLVECREGELLVTTLSREAMPLLRYCTRTACELRREKCACGRTGRIIVPGQRLDGRLRVGEVPLYEAQIASVLAATKAAGRAFHMDIQEDRIALSVELTADLFSDALGRLVSLKHAIEAEFFGRLGIPVDVGFMQPQRGS